jgi:nucleoside-diphosphate-sugar epimerase
MYMKTNTPVLVTGASGFIAIHCIIQLLEQGYHVRGTLRSMDRENELRKTLAKFVQANDKLTFAQADLLADAGWAEAMQGYDYVLHVASPFPVEAPKDENDLIRPAKEGTLRVLRAAAEHGIKRVVLTSSVAAIAAGHPRAKTHFDEKDWSLPLFPSRAAIQGLTPAQALASLHLPAGFQNWPANRSRLAAHRWVGAPAAVALAAASPAPPGSFAPRQSRTRSRSECRPPPGAA